LVGSVFGIFIGEIIVSNLALFGASWFLYKLVERQSDHETGKRAVTFMFLFPTAFMFSCILTESLFIFVSITSFYFAKRGNWLVAGLLGGCETLTRSVGIFLVIPLFLEYVSQRNFKIKYQTKFLFLGFVPLGTLIFMIICYSITGNPFAMIDIQSAWGASSFTNPIWVFWDSLFGKHMFVAQIWFNRHSYTFFVINNIIPGAVLGALISIYCLYALVKGYRKVEISLFVYSFILILFQLSSSIISTLAMSRYCLVVFSVFIILARTIGEGGRSSWATLSVFAIFQTVAMSLWTNAFHIL